MPGKEREIMSRYFKLTEISQEEYIDAGGEDLGPWSQCIDPMPGAVYVAIAEANDDIEIPADSLDVAFGGFDYDEY